MRQGNGTDILGAHDPNSASVGIIYVALGDDRKSVLAAIITQEKLGRKQVVIVLPQPNNAFQRPVDFDDLRSLRRKLQSQIIFIAPGGSNIAEYARQRRFPVYSSLESYARAFRNNEVPEEKKSRIFSLGGGWGKSQAEPSKGQNSSLIMATPDGAESIEGEKGEDTAGVRVAGLLDNEDGAHVVSVEDDDDWPLVPDKSKGSEHS